MPNTGRGFVRFQHGWLMSGGTTAWHTTVRANVRCWCPFEHKESTGHKTAQWIQETSKKETLEKVCDSMNASYLKATSAVFRSAYYLAQNDSPFLNKKKKTKLKLQVGRAAEREWSGHWHRDALTVQYDTNYWPHRLWDVKFFLLTNQGYRR